MIEILKSTSYPAKARVLPLFVLFLLAIPSFVRAQSDIQYTGTNGTWTDGSNWVGGIAPGSNDDANFRDNGNGFTTLSVNGITISHMDFSGASILGYTIGTGGAGSETFSFDGAGANTEGIFLNNNLSGDITVDANIDLVGAGQQYRFDNRDLDNNLIVNGAIDAAGSGNQVLNFGNFTQRASDIILNGDVTISTSSRLDMNVLGAQVTVNGSVVGTGNTMRTTVRDGGILTVSSTGSIGQGSVTIREGQILLNNTTTAQLFDDGLNFGNATTGDGDSTLTIASGATLDLDSGITYFADDNVANKGTLTGGTVDLSGVSRAYTINDNALLDGTLGNTEMTFSTMFRGTNSNGGATNGDVEDFTIRGAGAITWDSTFSSTASELVDVLILENAKTVIATGSAGADFTNLRRELLVRQRDSAALSDFAVELDINGNEVILDDDLIIGQFRNRTVASEQFITISDSADSATSKIRLTSDNDITYHDGLNGDGSDGSSADNVTAFITADLQFEGSNFTIQVQDGASDVDLDVSGTITDDNGGGRNFSKTQSGTLKLSATDNVYNILFIDDGTVQITNAGALGDNDISFGQATTDGVLEYVDGAGDTISNQVRIGQSDAADIGTGTILNNANGGLTFSNGTFNQVVVAGQDRAFTLGGTNSVGVNTIEGLIQDNTGGTVSIVKEGTNTWVLADDNTYTGATTVSEGQLDIGGTNTTNISVASAATLGGEGSTTGTLTLADGSTIDGVDGSTAGALTASAGLDLTGVSAGGILVNFVTGGPGAFTVLDYNSIATGFTAGSGAGFFTDNTGLAASGRSGGGGTFGDTGTAITFDLGFATRTWAAAATTGNWTNANTTDNNWVEDDNDYFDGDAVIFTNSDVDASAPAADQTITLTTDVTPSTITFTNNTNTYTIDDNGGGEKITGTTSIEKSGTARVFINNANDFSGGTFIREGSIEISDSAALGTGTITISDEGSDSPALRVTTDGLTITNDIVISNSGARKDITFSATGSGNTLTLAGNIRIDETSDFNADFRPNAGETIIVTGLISGTGTPVLEDDGTLRLTNDANTFDNALRIQGNGVIEITSIADEGVASAAGLGVVGTGVDVTLGTANVSGTLSLIDASSGTPSSSTDRQVRIGTTSTTAVSAGGGAIENNRTNGGTGLVFTNAAFNIQDTNTSGNTRERTLTLGGTNTDDNEIQGVIADNAATGVGAVNTINLVKDGIGTWNLSGANTYTGTTSVNEGTLLVNNASGSGTGTGAVTVASGATLGGTGTIGSTLADGTTISNGGFLTAGTNGTTGTLGFAGDLTTETGSTWLVDLAHNLSAGSGGSVDLINTAGTLDVTGANLVVNETGTFLLGETYQIASYGSLNGTFSGLGEGATLSGSNGGLFEITYTGGGGNFITLTAVPEPAAFLPLVLLLGAGFYIYRRRRLAETAAEQA